MIRARTILVWPIVALVLLAACAGPTKTGSAIYAEDCATCHGPRGAGDGPAAANLPVPPADLTRIAARNGGVYDRVAVMSWIDGYARGDSGHGAMPAFGALLEGRRVMIETGDGIMTPTPERLVALAEYLESLQQP